MPPEDETGGTFATEGSAGGAAAAGDESRGVNAGSDGAGCLPDIHGAETGSPSGSRWWSSEDGDHRVGEAAAGDRAAADADEPPAEDDKMAVVEALLFVSPDPLSTGRIAEITGIDQGAVREILNRITRDYERKNGGLVVREVAGGFGFYAVPAAAPYIARLISSQVNPRLTRAALETIAVVAYLQPVSRGLVAEIRGVQSEGVMKTLEERGLVEPAGKGGPPGYPLLYRTTGKFLERFGLKSLEDLPPLEQFSPDEEMVEKIKRSLSWEIMENAGERANAGAAGPEGRGPDAAGAGTGTEDTGGGGDSLQKGLGGPDNVGPGDG